MDEKDIVPELLELIQNAFKNKFKSNDEIKRLNKLLEDKNSNQFDSHHYAMQVGDILSESFLENISEDVLPNQTMYYNIAKRVLEPTMSLNHELVSTYALDTQTNLNKQAGLNIRGIKAELNQDRIDGIIEKLSSDTFEKTKWVLVEPIENFTQAVVDDTVKYNAKFHHELGLSPKIVRKEHGHCCDWCKQLVGEYEYSQAPDDIYKRHGHCRCTVEYDPGNGAKKRQNVHTKQWKESQNNDKIEERKKEISKHGKFQAKTIKEANKVAEEMGFKADYSGIDIKCANEWNKGLYESKKKFPEITENIKFVGASQKRYSLMKKDFEGYYIDLYKNIYYEKFVKKGFNPDLVMKEIEKLAKKEARERVKNFKVSSFEMASSWSHKYSAEKIEKYPEFEIFNKYRGITMNNKYYNNYGTALQNGIKQVKNKWTPEGCQTVKSTFDHEFGHQIDEYLKVRDNDKIQKIFNEKSNEQITENLSRYSWDNDNKNKYAEMIAEGWSEYCNNDKPREMAETIGKVIEELWEKK